jgi:translocon-associated protein subunit gamma
VKREAAVTKEMNAKMADDKKLSRKEKDERILWKKNEVAEYESTTFAIFYNNALFLSVLIFVSFYIFPTKVGASINYVASMGVSAGLIALLSTGTGSA